jgi:hypothetical protein
MASERSSKRRFHDLAIEIGERIELRVAQSSAELIENLINLFSREKTGALTKWGLLSRFGKVIPQREPLFCARGNAGAQCLAREDRAKILQHSIEEHVAKNVLLRRLARLDRIGSTKAG